MNKMNKTLSKKDIKELHKEQLVFNLYNQGHKAMSISKQLKLPYAFVERSVRRIIVECKNM